MTRSTALRTHQQQQQQQPVSLKIPCPVCGKRVLPRSMNRHQQSSKTCLHSYEIIETRSFRVKKYGATGIDYTIKVNVASQVEPAIDRMIAMAKEKANYTPGDVIIVVASHPQFRHDISSKVSSSGVNARSFANHVQRIISSNETFDITNIRWNVKIINVPRGRACAKRIINLASDVRTKKCILRIRNKDDMCGARAVVTALTYHRDTILDRPVSDLEKKYVRKGRRLQTTLAEELCTRLGGYTAGGFTLEDFARTERLLVDVQIKIVSSDCLNTIVYEGDEADTVLYLYKTGDHFDVITSMRAFFGSCYYCERCDTPYRNKNRYHRCKKTKVCHMCSERAHAKLLPETYCEACDRYCYDDECLAAHRRPDGVCENWYKCSGCNLVRSRHVNHGCGYYKCRNCLKFKKFDKPHRCHMTQKIQKGGVCGCVECDCYCGGGGKCTAPDGHKCTYTEKYLFFDYEAIQESGVHEANYVHVENFYGNLSESFHDNDSFCRWLLTDDHKGYTCIAHNAKGYDSHFILRYCVENAIAPKTVYTGTKLMELAIPGLGIRVIDSFNFVAEPLSAFPKTFGLTELKKGFFPHLFNTRANQDYVGPIPDTTYYCPDTMKPAAREEFLKWHAERRGDQNYVFHFRRELEEYCKSDVDILRRGCLTLRDEFLKIANIDPFCYMTIASVCMGVYRSKYLQWKTLAVVKSPDHEAPYSKESIAWLTSLIDDDEDNNTNIVHALNGGGGGEVRICGVKVDGYCAATKTVYQFHGCFWHGCVKCYDPTLVNRKNRHTMGDLYMRTKRRTQQLRDAGYRVVEMWECEWLPQYRRLRLHTTATTVVERDLNPRDAFFGGRTNACKLRVTGKKLRYIDVVSLYPTVMFYDRYPVGHPIKIDSPRRYAYNWFGLVKCRVLPPAGLYHPVLPVKLDKLVFPLCAACAVEKCRQCRHDVNERALTGTWTTIEMRRALGKGYKIMNIYSVWHFPKTSTDLFRGYVKDFLKIKLETSDWRKDFVTLDDYVNAVRLRNDIELDPEQIATNPGKRAVAKICLNSLWGKFGQRQNMSQTRYVVDPSEFYKTLLDTRLDKTNVTFVNENVAQIVYNKKSMIVEDPNNINIFVAVFTTAHARLRLYDMMDRLGENVVYYDTDSIVYIDDDDGRNKVRTGCMLGDWNDELGAEDWITEWASTGPKSYAYETAKNRDTCKIKGFTLNYRNSQKLNMSVMKSLLAGEVSRTEIVYDQICRDTVSKKLVNKSVRKTFKMDYDKRMIVPPDETRHDDTAEVVVVVDTLPWGYNTVNQ